MPIETAENLALSDPRASGGRGHLRRAHPVRHGLLSAVALALAFLAAPALGADEPYAFKNIPLDLPLAKVDTARYDCHNKPSAISDMICALRKDQRETIAGVPATIVLLFMLKNRVSAIQVRFATQRYGEVLEAFTERYGKPERTSSTEAIWQNKVSRIDVTPAGRGGTTGMALYRMNAAQSTFEERERKERTDRAKDL